MCHSAASTAVAPPGCSPGCAVLLQAVPSSFTKRELLALCKLQLGTACATADSMTTPSAAWQVCHQSV